MKGILFDLNLHFLRNVNRQLSQYCLNLLLSSEVVQPENMGHIHTFQTRSRGRGTRKLEK